MRSRRCNMAIQPDCRLSNAFPSDGLDLQIWLHGALAPCLWQCMALVSHVSLAMREPQWQQMALWRIRTADACRLTWLHGHMKKRGWSRNHSFGFFISASFLRILLSCCLSPFCNAGLVAATLHHFASFPKSLPSFSIVYPINATAI